MRNKLGSFMIFSSMFLCTAVSAESMADKLTRIEAETMLLKARERQLDVQAKIVARQLEISAKKAENERVIYPSTMGNPVVYSIEGLGETMYATLQLQGGALIEVQAGDTLDNGMKVLSIRPNEVIILTRKKQPMRLGLPSVLPATYDPGSAGSWPRLPPPPPMADPRSVAR